MESKGRNDGGLDQGIAEEAHWWTDRLSLLPIGLEVEPRVLRKTVKFLIFFFSLVDLFKVLSSYPHMPHFQFPPL